MYNFGKHLIREIEQVWKEYEYYCISKSQTQYMSYVYCSISTISAFVCIVINIFHDR